MRRRAWSVVSLSVLSACGEGERAARAVPEPAPCPSEGVNFPGEAWLRVGRPFVGMLTPAQVVAQHAVIER